MSTNYLPTEPNKRIEIIDILRGFAVLGILLSNILIMSGFLFTPFEDLNAFKSAGLNNILYTIHTSIISGKFYPIFCILLGFGFFMQIEKYKNKSNFTQYFIRRLLVLLIIGIFHQLIWPGDVVTTYALAGLLLVPIKNISQKQLLLFSIFLVVLNISIGIIPSLFSSQVSQIAKDSEQIARFQFPGVDPHSLINDVRNNGIAGMYNFFIPQYKFLWSLGRLKTTTPLIFALIFLGGYFYKTSFFSIQAHKLKYTVLFFVIGISGSFLYYYVSGSLRILDNLFLSLFYMCGIAALYHSTTLGKGLEILAPVGRMALTSYVMQSIICAFVFYGFGFKLFAKLPLHNIFYLSAIILLFQIAFCNLWLRNYKFGPLEMLWRKLSYKNVQPKEITEVYA
jgi:uncharacterized protein